jgi:hypothetical protein
MHGSCERGGFDKSHAATNPQSGGRDVRLGEPNPRNIAEVTCSERVVPVAPVLNRTDRFAALLESDADDAAIRALLSQKVGHECLFCGPRQFFRPVTHHRCADHRAVAASRRLASKTSPAQGGASVAAQICAAGENSLIYPGLLNYLGEEVLGA